MNGEPFSRLGTERIELCLDCGELRGPWPSGLIQWCDCDLAASPEPQPRWPRYDHNTMAELCRCCEVPAGTTVVFCDAKAVANTVRSLYSELAHLAPALVVMEDIDLVVGDRHRRGPSKALVDFLLALDGAISSHKGVVTVATTNDAASIDAAAKRAARFDRLVEVPPPDAAGRAAILARYLRALEADIDVDRVAAATDGATGADLRELVTLAVLHASRTDGDGDVPAVTTELLLRLAAEAGYQVPTGLYL